MLPHASRRISMVTDSSSAQFSGPKPGFKTQRPASAILTTKSRLHVLSSKSHQGLDVNVSEVSFVPPPPPSLSLPKNAKTRCIAFPQTIQPAAQTPPAGKRCLHLRCSVPTLYILSTPRRRRCAVNLNTIYPRPANHSNPQKSRRQAHTPSRRAFRRVPVLSAPWRRRAAAPSTPRLCIDVPRASEYSEKKRRWADIARTFNGPCPVDV
ncbi:hypothetical protein C8R47DRAFT_36647 [Mycena vitilis]|nr:hypothetical protein C8R47DRAFT_36647 [Mycena vitilis]